ncbi:MAG: hypothetical protein ACREJ2_03775 [Planctomycetota bacterium]
MTQPSASSTPAAAKAAPEAPVSGPPDAPNPAPPGAAGAGMPVAPLVEKKKFDARNVLIMVLIGAVVIMAVLLYTFMTQYRNRAQKDLGAEMQAPNYQTAPGKNPGVSVDWYIRRGREALKQHDMTTCRQLLDDAEDLLKREPRAFSAAEQQKLKDLEEDWQTAQPQPVR